MLTQESEYIITACHEARPLKETSAELLDLLTQSEDGVISYVRLYRHQPYLSHGGLHSSIARLNGRLSQTGNPLSISFEKTNIQSLGFGFVSHDEDDEWQQENLFERLKKQTVHDILDCSEATPWYSLGSYCVTFPDAQTGYYPAPTIAVIKYTAGADEVREPLLLTPYERDVLRLYAANGGYVDKYMAADHLHHSVDLKKAIPHLIQKWKTITGLPLAHQLQRIGYPGYSFEENLASRNAYLRSVIESSSNLQRIRKNASSFLSRHVKWNNAGIMVGICRLDEAFEALKYRNPPFYIGSDTPYMLTINRDDSWDGFTFEQTLITETTPLAYQLVGNLRNTPSIPIDHLKGDAKRNFKQRFKKIGTVIESAGYTIDDGSGVARGNAVIFPIPALR